MIKIVNDRGLRVDSLDTEKKRSIRIYDKGNNKEIQPKTELNRPIEINRSYYMDLLFLVDGEEGTDLFKSPDKTSVLIGIHSKALGDQVAWVPICDLFQKKHNCKLIVACKFPELFQPFYSNIEFVRQYFKGENIPNPDEKKIALDRYILGYAVRGYKNEDGIYVSPVDCRTVGLQDVACHELGIEPQDLQPEFYSNIQNPIIKGKYIVLTTCAAGDFKFWHYKNGWKEIVKYFKKQGLKVVHIGKTPYKLKDTMRMTGNLEWNKLMNIIQHAQLFIGLSSGLSWLAWALGQKVVTINGISEDWAQFTHTKITNKKVCNGCWNDTSFVYENNNPNYCPRKKDFECTRMISPEMVITGIENTL